MGWFTSEPTHSNPKKSSDGLPEAPSRNQRQKCYEGRDLFFRCLDQHNIIDSIKEKDKAAQACPNELEAFQKACASSWVHYFKGQRVGQWVKDRQIEKLKEEGAENLEAGPSWVLGGLARSYGRDYLSWARAPRQALERSSSLTRVQLRHVALSINAYSRYYSDTKDTLGGQQPTLAEQDNKHPVMETTDEVETEERLSQSQSSRRQIRQDIEHPLADPSVSVKDPKYVVNRAAPGGYRASTLASAESSTLTEAYQDLPGRNRTDQEEQTKFVENLETTRNPSEDLCEHVSGSIQSVRRQKRHIFLRIRSRHGRIVHAVVDQEDPELSARMRQHMDSIREGAAASAAGRMRSAPETSQHNSEMEIKDLAISGPVDITAYPIQPKHLSAPLLRSRPHARNHALEQRFVLLVRSGLEQSFSTSHLLQPPRAAHNDPGMTRVHTPLLTSGDCEGAGETFSVAASDGAPFFPRPAYLNVSAQLHLESMLPVVGNVWTLSPTFRAERSQTSRHLSEFYMLEAEFSWVELANALRDLEGLLRAVLSKMNKVLEDIGAHDEPIRHHPSPEMRAWHERCLRAIDRLSGHWAVISYTEIIQELIKSGAQFEQPPKWETGLAAEHEKWIVKTWNKGMPVFVTDYPSHIKPFYMGEFDISGRDSCTPGLLVNNFDLLFPRVGELVGGSRRIHKYGQLVRSMRKKGMLGQESKDAAQKFEAANSDVPPWSLEMERRRSRDPIQGLQDLHPYESFGNLEWYVEMRKWGCPPHSGWGLGFDRLLAYILDLRNVKDVVPFPRWAGNLEC